MVKSPKKQTAETSPLDELSAAFGRKVREARDKAGLSRVQLAEKTGLATSYIFELETEGANVTLKTVSRIAEALGLGARDLMPESSRDALTSSGIASLIAAIDRATAVLKERQSQEVQIIDDLLRFGHLRDRLEKLASDGGKKVAKGTSPS
ncbi:MAG: helix-turn-helix transcriptional regulator [Alphaproteobacteria bacterium]|nr:helix-turn-helix transcriptional regulator [Alphaproteobacteria bacterium]